MTDRKLDTAMWLKNPSAFWLHPEGPLSDTTPEEWLAKQKPPEPPPVLGVQMIHLPPGTKLLEVKIASGGGGGAGVSLDPIYVGTKRLPLIYRPRRHKRWL